MAPPGEDVITGLEFLIDLPIVCLKGKNCIRTCILILEPTFVVVVVAAAAVAAEYAKTAPPVGLAAWPGSNYYCARQPPEACF